MRDSSILEGVSPANSMDQDSFDSPEEANQVLLSKMNGISLSSVAKSDLDCPSSEDQDEADFPRTIIVTNVDVPIFENEGLKLHFEQMFREFDSNCVFHYLKSFRRVRVDFECHLNASNAKLNLDGTPLGDNIIHCYFIQLLSSSGNGGFLHVPPVTRQFLISPPASPPVGWEQPREDRPVVDYDLIAAMAQLLPGEQHELHPSNQVTLLGRSFSTPSIVVHICEGGITMPQGGLSTIRTKCPGRQYSLE